MKKIIAILLTLTLCLGVFVACGNNGEVLTDPTTSAQTNDNALEGTLTLGGSSSVEKVVKALMEQYMSDNSGVKITYAPTGSSTGIQGAAEKSLNIGLSSKDLSEDEKAKLTQTVFALDGIAIAVNPANTITDISLDDIAKIAKGEIKNWSELGGADKEIVLIGRDAASGTRDGFESIIGVKEECVYAEEQASTGAVIASVSANEGAIGYISLASISDKINVLTVDGVEPTAETILDGSYKIQRNFVFATLTNDTSELAQDFIDWATTNERAQELISAADAIALG